MDSKIISPIPKHQHASFVIPGSKSLTNRALLLAALADGKSILQNPLESEDTLHMQSALQGLGVDILKTANSWNVTGTGGKFVSGDQDFFLGNAGTAMRFLTAMGGLVRGNIRLGGKSRMEERPIQDLLLALQDLGVDLSSENQNGCPPIRISGTGEIPGGNCRISGATSSQFLSALLLVGAKFSKGIHMEILPPLVSAPYLLMTVRLLESFGIVIEHPDSLNYRIAPQTFSGKTYSIEADASSAMHIYSLALPTESSITIENFPENSLQGDAHFFAILNAFGASCEGKTVRHQGALKALREQDLESMPDAALNAIALAALAPGKTLITGLRTLRDKECDRIAVMAENLQTLGATVETFPEAIAIIGNPDTLHGGFIKTHDDHRIAMSFALLGSSIPGVIIENPKCVEKTFPNFWDLYQQLEHGH